MQKAISVKYVGTKTRAGRVEHTFKVLNTESSIKSIVVVGFYNRILTIDQTVKCDISVFANLVGGLFHPKSNFFYEVKEQVYHEEAEGIEFTFNEVPMIIRKDGNNDCEAIVRKYNDELYYSVMG